MLTHQVNASLVGVYNLIHTLHFKGNCILGGAFSSKGGCLHDLCLKTPPTLESDPVISSVSGLMGNSHQSRFSPDFHIPYETGKTSLESSTGTYFGCVFTEVFSLRCVGFLCFSGLYQLQVD